VGAGHEVSVQYGICMMKQPTVVPVGPALSVSDRRHYLCLWDPPWIPLGLPYCQV
jgi:hypothetical protein